MGDPTPFLGRGGSTGCLLLHGWTGSPAEMRLLGDYLYAHGVTVSGPLLPGHGTTPEEMARCHWQDWADASRKALEHLQSQCERVFVGGLSMGALLAAHLAVQCAGIAGLLLYSPALMASDWKLALSPVAKYVMPMTPAAPPEKTDLTDPEAPGRLWHYQLRPTAAAAELLKLQRVVRRELPGIAIPSIVVYSTADGSIHHKAGPQTFARLGSSDKELYVLHNSGHCLTVDSEREQVFARSLEFIVAHSAPG